MNFYTRRFNLYLAFVLIVPLCGCMFFKNELGKKKAEKTSAVRIHLESPVSVPGKTRTVSLLRSAPVAVTIDEEPVLTEVNLLAAELIDTYGSYAVHLRFDETGGWALEQSTAGNPGKHLVIFGQWGETNTQGRFLAAPIISRRIAGGELTFSPDASREETQQFVDGLNNLARILHTPQKK